MKKIVIFLILSLFLNPAVTYAQNNLNSYPFKETMTLEQSTSRLGGDIKFYFGKQPHDRVSKNFGEFTASKKTNALWKSDQAACQWVFLSAMLSLRSRAIKEGGNAIINIKSNYDNIVTAGNDIYECNVGFFVAGVVLKGTVVKLDQSVNASTSHINIAVSEFSNLSEVKEYEWLKSGISDLIISFLSGAKNIQLVERNNLKQILQEQELLQGGILTENNASRISYLVGASHIISGSYHINDENISINARMFETETGKLLRAENIEGNIDDVNNIIKNMVLKLSGGIDNSLTGEEKQKIASHGENMLKKIEAIT